MQHAAHGVDTVRSADADADAPPTSVAFANVRAAWMRRWTICFRRSRHSPLRAIALARAIHAERRLHLARRNVLDLPPLLRDAARHVHSSFSSPSLLLTASVLSLCRSMKSGASCRAWRRRYVATLHTTLHTTLYRADTGTRTQTQAHFGGHRDTKGHVRKHNRTSACLEGAGTGTRARAQAGRPHVRTTHRHRPQASAFCTRHLLSCKYASRNSSFCARAFSSVPIRCT